MSKQEIVAAFNARGEFQKHSHSFDNVWAEAFKLYTAATKDGVNQRCGSCYGKVKKWLQS